jgi:hypothetical protein
MAKTYNLTVSFNEMWFLIAGLKQFESERKKDSESDKSKRTRRSHQQEVLEIKNLRTKLIGAVTALHKIT